MPRTKKAANLGAVAHADLVYAVRCLIQSGKTTTAEVERLANERGQRIKSLEAELAGLRAGGLAPGPATLVTGRIRRVGRKAKSATEASPKTTKPASTAKTGRSAVGKTIVRKDGRTFTVTPAVIRARKLQGKYLTFLRQVPASERDRFKGVAKDKGVAAAVKAMAARVKKS